MIKNEIPDTMTAVCINQDGSIGFRSMPVPRPLKGEVLVKISASPVNPSDLARIRHVRGTGSQLLFTPGIEGSGRVVLHGKGILPSLWNGRRVACSPSRQAEGTWAEYIATAAANCIPLPKGVDDEQGSMLLVNPLTAIAFIETAIQKKHRALVNTSAAGALGRMTEILATEYKIPVINIVHNVRQKDRLIAEGSKYVIDSSGTSFNDELHEMAGKLNATLLLDAVGGRMTRDLLLAAPSGATVMVYGNLSATQPEIDHASLVTDNKTVTGFFLANWLKEVTPLLLLHCIIKARKLLKQGYKIQVSERFSLTEAQKAIDKYLSAMSSGKVLFKP